MNKEAKANDAKPESVAPKGGVRGGEVGGQSPEDHADGGAKAPAPVAGVSTAPSVAPMATEAPAPLKEANGSLEAVTPDRVSGWVWNPAKPAEKSTVNIYFDGLLVATVVANAYRRDLEQAKVGDGRHAFEWIPPRSKLPANGCEVTASTADNRKLKNTPKRMPAAPASALPEAKAASADGGAKAPAPVAGASSAPSVGSTATEAPAPLKEAIGSLEVVTPDRVSGWVWNPAKPAEKSTINIYFDGLLVATVVADAYRRDLEQAKVGDGRHAFEWIPPRSKLPANGCEVTALTAENRKLKNSPKMMPAAPASALPEAKAASADGGAKAPAPVAGASSAPSVGSTATEAPAPLKEAIGSLEVVTPNRVSGWVWNPAKPAEKSTVNIYFDGLLVATVVADAYRRDLEQSKVGDGRHAFEWIPPRSKLPANGCEVTALTADNRKLKNTPKRMPPVPAAASSRAKAVVVEGDFIGTVEQAEPYRISGWAFNRDRPTERVNLELFLNGTPLVTVTCNEYRPDLKNRGYGDGRHGFSWTPDPEMLLPGSYTVEAKVYGAGIQIGQTANMLYKPAVLIDGAVKIGDDGLLEGWVWNKLRRAEPISVGLFEGENLLVGAIADRYDPKLVADGIGTGAHGFSMRVPSFYDGEPRVLSVRALPSSVELAGSPLTLPPHVGRQTSLAPSRRSMEPEQTNHTLIEAVTNFSRYSAPPDAEVDLDAYRRSCMDGLSFIFGDEKSARSSPIVFPVFAEPRISIIIPAYNQFEYTWRCLKSVAVATWGLSFEVILMDDCSSDETVNLPRRVQGLRYVRQERNKHFILNCNQGARAARGAYLYFLNNDTELTPNAIRALLQTFKDFPEAGVVGSKLIYPDGAIQEVGCAIWEDGEGHTFGRHERDALLPQYRYLRECHYVSGASLLIPRDLFERVGGFDERFVPAYSEDSDLCMSVRAAGRKVLVQPMSVVVHYERVSSSAEGDRTSSTLMRQNKPKFLSKWGVALARHPRSTDRWDLVKDVGISRRCLFFDWRTPRIDEDAGSYAALQEMRVLQSLGAKVTFASTEMDYAGRHTELLQRLGVECVYAPYYKNWQTFLDQRGAEFDFVYGMRFEIMEQAIEKMRETMPQAKIIFNCADLHFLRSLREARLKSSLNDPTAGEAFAKADGIKDRELSVMGRSDAIIVYNEVEREVVQTELPASSAVVMPWIVPARETIPPWSERSGVAFLGSYQHVPNRDAVDFFARQVMPLIREKVPDCVFHIYGSDMVLMKKSLEGLEKDGVNVVGSVKEVSEAFDRHRVFVAPLRYGAGIKGKVVMALCNGIPTVLTPVATEGMNVRGGQEVVLAETPNQFAEAVIELHENPARWQAVSDAALKFGRETFSAGRARDVLRKLILEVGIAI